MKVLLQTNVNKLGIIGDVVNVKAGYARNYLLPQGLAVEPTAANVKVIEVARQKHLEEMCKLREEFQAKAKLVDGKEITIQAKANDEGHLYGSIGSAQVAAALAGEKIFIDEGCIKMEPIRQLDKYTVNMVFDKDITASITVWVVRESSDESAE